MTANQDFNPYAAPVSSRNHLPPPRSGQARIEGDCMVVTTGTVLPLRCVGTNSPCTLREHWVREFNYAPSFRLVVNRRHCRIYRCLSSKYRRDRFLTRGLIAAATFALFAMLTWTFVFPAIVSIVVFFSRPIDRLKVVKHRHGEFWIKGCHPDFLDSLATEDGWPRHAP